MKTMLKTGAAFGLAAFIAAVGQTRAEASELTLCWAAWDPANALVELSKDFEKQTGITVQYQKTGSSPTVSDGVAINVYRVVQEALNNLAKHSKSSLAWVRVDFATDRLHLEVEDRGIGLPLETAGGVRRGLGMVAMRERAELLRGKIEFSRPAEGGTLIRLDVPLPTTDSYGQ